MYPDDDWLVEYVQVSEPLARALGIGWNGHAQRTILLDELAGQLQLNAERLREDGYVILEALLDPLQEAMEAGPGSWLEGHDPHVRVADRAVENLSLTYVIGAFADFGWHRQRLRQDVEVGQLDAELRELLARGLAQRLFKAFERWRKNNVWNTEMTRRAENRKRR